MSYIFRPMLACEPQIEKWPIKFPVLASFKLDGVRALVKDGVVLSRTLKPIPNKHVQARYGIDELEGFDGELIAHPSNSPTAYIDTVSMVMSRDASTDTLLYAVFDKHDMLPDTPYYDRANYLKQLIYLKASLLEALNIAILHQYFIKDQTQLKEIKDLAISLGFEGLILRSLDSPYKMGRSTAKEGWMIKLKDWVDSEARILEIVEGQTNTNEAQLDERGYTKRSTHKEGKVGAGMAGAFVVEDIRGRHYGMTFQVGMGKATHPERIKIWKDREKMKGRIIKYKYFPVGMKEAPRHPSFLSFFEEL